MPTPTENLPSTIGGKSAWDSVNDMLAGLATNAGNSVGTFFQQATTGAGEALNQVLPNAFSKWLGLDPVNAPATSSASQTLGNNWKGIAILIVMVVVVLIALWFIMKG